LLLQKGVLQIPANPDIFIIRVIVVLNFVVHSIFLIPFFKPKKNAPLIKETGFTKRWVLLYILGVILYSGILSFYDLWGFISTCISIILLFAISIFIPAVIKINSSFKTSQSVKNNIDFDAFCKLYEISKREAEIVLEICSGLSNKAISEKLFITLQTVKDHNHHIFIKTGVKSRVQLSNLVREKTGAKFSVNEVIYKEGDKPTGLICLSEGKVKIFKEGVGGREQIVRMAKPVGFIGYRALFAEENYIASAIAIEDSVVCNIEKKALFEMLKVNSQFSSNIIKSLATELGFSNSRTVTLTQKHIRGRLAESLLFLVDTYGLEDNGKTIKVYLSREDIANLSNMTTSNAIRTLSTFASESVINLDGRKISINDMKVLNKISEMG